MQLLNLKNTSIPLSLLLKDLRSVFNYLLAEPHIPRMQVALALDPNQHHNRPRHMIGIESQHFNPGLIPDSDPLSKR